MNEEKFLSEELQQEPILQDEESLNAQPVEETFVQEEPALEAPAEEEPIEAAPETEQPQGEMPIQEETSEEGPAEDQPVEELPTEAAVPEEAAVSVEETAEEGTAEEAPAEEQPVVEAPAEPAEEPSVFDFKKIPYHERYYLRYREGKRTVPLDLDGTKAFLQGIGFDGGELRQAREGRDHSETFHSADRNKGNQMYCSYCGAEISGVEFYRLPDGRLRCTTCSNTLVKTKAEAEELCQRVIDNLDNFFGATIDVPVSIEILDERKLKRKVGVPLGTRDSQSMLILGVAINKKKSYKILLENGAPRISLIATFAHELTHIWQYTHWDNKKNFPKCPKDKRLLIYEGMAKWAEIQYLYLIGETAVAKREEFITRQREDAYGVGFCMYDDAYPLSREAMSCEETPFTPNRYPLGSEDG